MVFLKRRIGNDNIIKKKNRSKYLILFSIILSLTAATIAGKGIYIYLQLTPVLAAKHEIPPFTVLTDEDLQIIHVPKIFADGKTSNKSNLIGKAVRTTIPEGVAFEKVYLAPDGAGSILSSKVTDLKNPKVRAFTLPVDALASCGGDIVEGDIIDIVGAVSIKTTNKNVNSTETFSKVLAPQVRVIKVLGQGKDTAGITVALTPLQIQEIQFAILNGKISIAVNPYNADPNSSITEPTTPETFLKKYFNNNKQEQTQ